MDKTLGLVSHLIVHQHNPASHEKGAKSGKKPLSRRASANNNTVPSLENLHIELSGEEGAETDLSPARVDNKKKPLHFITQLKSLLKSPNRHLKSYILKHVKAIASKIPQGFFRSYFFTLIG